MPKKPVLNTIANRMKRARLAKNLSQAQVAARMKLGKHGCTIISAYENGRREPRVNRVAAFCRAVGCKISDVIP